MKQRLRLFGGVILLGLIAGYASALFGRSACEDQVARDVIRWAHQPGMIYVLPDWATASSIAFSRVRVTVRSCDTAIMRDCKPLAGIQRADVSAPFVVTVKWMFSATPGSGIGSSGGRRRFLCIFGKIVELAPIEYETS